MVLMSPLPVGDDGSVVVGSPVGLVALVEEDEEDDDDEDDEPESKETMDILNKYIHITGIKRTLLPYNHKLHEILLW